MRRAGWNRPAPFGGWLSRYKDDSVLDRENETIVSYGFQHATRLHRAKLVILAAAAKYVHGDRLPYPDVWYDDGRIAVSILKRLR